MMCKSSKPPRIRLSAARLAWVLALCLGLGGGIASGGAQTTPTPSPSPSAKPKQAFLRFWNMLPGKNSDLLQLLVADDKPLTTAVPSNYYAGYFPVVPGTFTLTVCHPGDTANPLKRLPVNLPPDAYVTVLASVKDGQPTVEAINDTIDPATNNTGRLVLRQYVPGAHVTAAVGGAPPTAALGYGETAVLDNLPTGQFVVNVQATFASGPPKNWSVPADLSLEHHGTLLVVADPYGRFRPRLTVDGHAVIAPPPTSAH